MCPPRIRKLLKNLRHVGVQFARAAGRILAGLLSVAQISARPAEHEIDVISPVLPVVPISAKQLVAARFAADQILVAATGDEIIS